MLERSVRKVLPAAVLGLTIMLATLLSGGGRVQAARARRQATGVSFFNGTLYGVPQQGLIFVPTDAKAKENGFGKERIDVSTSPGTKVKLKLITPNLQFVGTNVRELTATAPDDGVVRQLLQSERRGREQIEVTIANNPPDTFSVIAFILRPDYKTATLSLAPPLIPTAPAKGEKASATQEATPGFGTPPMQMIDGKHSNWPTGDISGTVQSRTLRTLTVDVSGETRGEFNVVADPADPSTTGKTIKAKFSLDEIPTVKDGDTSAQARPKDLAVSTPVSGSASWFNSHESTLRARGLTLPNPTFLITLSSEGHLGPHQDNAAEQNFNKAIRAKPRASNGTLDFMIGGPTDNYVVKNEVKVEAVNTDAQAALSIRGGLKLNGVLIFIDPQGPAGFLQ